MNENLVNRNLKNHEITNKLTLEKNNEKIKESNRFKKYIIAARPWSFSASLIPALLGNVLVYIEQGYVDKLLFFLSLCCIIAIHSAGNLVNTYYDYQYGVDQYESDDNTLTHDILTEEDVATLCILSYLAGSIFFVLVVLLSDTRSEYLALLFFLGLSVSFIYTGSIGFKYHGLGDILIMFTFGPISTLFTYVVQSGYFSWSPIFYSIPVMLNAEAILHGNNSRDMENDMKAGIITLAILLGKGLSYLLYLILLFGPFEFIVVLGVIKSKFFWIPLITLPKALNLEKQFRTGNLKHIAQETASLSLLFGLSYTAVFILDYYVS